MQMQTLSGAEEQYEMFHLSKMDKGIVYWENVISCPNEFVDFIEKLDKEPNSYSRISKWSEWTASNDPNTRYGDFKTAVSNLDAFPMDDNKLEQRTRYIINSLKMATEMCIERYLDHFKLDKTKYKADSEVFRIRKWDIGQSMGPHADGQDGDYGLAFTIVLYLNDNYDGGEISFPNHGVEIKPKAGSLIMFPATSEFVHLVKPIMSNNRYSVPLSLVLNK